MLQRNGIVPPQAYCFDVILGNGYGRKDDTPDETLITGVEKGKVGREVLRDMGGFAYRVVAADSHACLEPNTRYKIVKAANNSNLPYFGQNLD